MTCSHCDAPIFADTEDWDSPLCYSHWHQFVVDHTYYELQKLVADLSQLHKRSVNLKKLLSEIITIKMDTPSSKSKNKI